MILMLGSCKNRDQSIQRVEGQRISKSITSFSFTNAVITLPSPASVKIDPGGRFYERFQGNINYVHYQYEQYGEEMLDAFASRHYSPGKLLERMWDGEYAGKWLDAATRVAVNTASRFQLAMVDQFAAALRKYQQPDGYMGVKLPTNRKLNDWEKSWDNWNQWNCMIGFITHYEFRGQIASLEAASAIGRWIINTFSPEKDDDRRFLKGGVTGGMTNTVIIGQLMRLYKHTGNPDLLDFVNGVIQQYPPIQRMLSTGEPFLFHPYMLCAVLNGIVQFAQETNDHEMLFKVEQVWNGLKTDHMFPTGSLGEREDLTDQPLKDVPDGQLQETCATTEWLFLTQRLYAVTGRAKYIEALEQTCYNALLAAQSADGMKWCYWTPLRYSKHFLYGPTRCCFWSGPRGIARLPQLIYAVKDNDVYVNLFESSHCTLSTAGGEVQVTQQSEFPVRGTSTVTIKTPGDWEGMLYIRVPGWASYFQVTYKGNRVSAESASRGYAAVKLRNGGVHQVEIQFDTPLILTRFGSENAAIRRGPEVLSIDARDNIDTWLGAHDDLITIPAGISFKPIDPEKRFQWAGPAKSRSGRRRYCVYVNDARTDEPRAVILTPYADAGNENAAFRTVFPLAEGGE
jgi:DUF1680 family protein